MSDQYMSQINKDELTIEELKHIVETLSRAVTCAVCLDVLQRDNLTCVNGHCICKKCQGKETCCPTCREAFSNVKQNCLVQQIVSIVPHPCSNENCSYLVKPEDDHELYCCFKPTKCTFCELDVPVGTLIDHVTIEHPNVTVYLENSQMKYSFWLGLRYDRVDHCLFVVYDHLLWLKVRNNSANGTVSFHFKPVVYRTSSRGILVNITYRAEDNDDEYHVSTRIKAEEKSLGFKHSEIRKFCSKKQNQVFYQLNITK